MSLENNRTDIEPKEIRAKRVYSAFQMIQVGMHFESSTSYWQYVKTIKFMLRIR